MNEKEYQAGLRALRVEWGKLEVDRVAPGLLRATKDQTTGIFVGMRSRLVAEIVNRALAEP